MVPSRSRVIAFGAVWVGQLVSVVGSSLTSFALGVWVYRERGSVTDFALVGFCAVLPRVVLAPVAGLVIDQVGRRRVMLAASFGGAVNVLILAMFAASGTLAVGHVYVAAGVAGALGTFEWPAWVAATSMLVRREHLGRASGLASASQAASDIAAPVLAALLLAVAGIRLILAVDLCSFLFAATALAVVRFPEPAPPPRAVRMRDDLLAGVRYIRADRALSRLAAFMVSVQVQWGLVAALFAPLVLGLGTTLQLGQALAAAGIGALTGSTLMSVWGGPRRRVFGIVTAEAVSGLAFLGMGLGPTVVVVGVAALTAHVTIPIIVGCNQAIWQQLVPHEIQGRVFAARQAIERAPAPFAYALAGPLVERLFNPALVPGGPLAGSLGHFFATGGSRGIGLLFACLGLIQIMIAVRALGSDGLREVEQRVLVGAPA